MMIFFLNINTFLYTRLFIDFHCNSDLLEGPSAPYNAAISPMLQLSLALPCPQGMIALHPPACAGIEAVSTAPTQVSGCLQPSVNHGMVEEAFRAGHLGYRR